MQNIITTNSEIETINAANEFAKQLKSQDIVLLTGDLGAGKSVFCRSIIRTLVGDKNLEVPSPTFTLLQTYDAEIAPIWHFDLYRLKSPEEIFELGWEDAVGHGILLIEWPEKLGGYLPKKYIHVKMSQNSNIRNIEIKYIY